MTERSAHLKLAVDVGSDPISGSVTVDQGAPTRFCGWIELVAAIEDARHDGGDAVFAIQEPAATESALG